MTDFITLTHDENRMTCPMPPEATIVEVRLADGTVRPAFFDCNIADGGDWDFAPVDAENEPTDGNFPIEVVAWRS